MRSDRKKTGHDSGGRSRSRLGVADEPDQLITAKRVRELLGDVSEMHIWRLVWLESYRALGFPKPAKINRRNYWSQRDISAWIKHRLEAGLTAEAA